VPGGQQVADLGDGLELGKVLLVEIDVRRGHVLVEMLHRARTGNQQHPLVTGQQPASATCVAVMPCRSAAIGVLHLGDVDELERAADGVGTSLADADQVEPPFLRVL
jgi:hypothetical protein